MVHNRISVATASLQKNLKRGLEQAMQLGADGVQFDLRSEITPAEYGETARRQLLHALSEFGLRIAAGQFPLRSPLAARDRLDERLSALRKAIIFAGELRMPQLILRPGRIPNDEQQDEQELFLGLLSELAEIGNRQGVEMCLIPSGSSGGEMLQLVDSIKTGRVSVAADPAAWILGHQNPLIELRGLASHIGHVSIRDAVRDLDGTGREVPVGRGEVDWDEFLALLSEMDYRGWLNVDRTEGNDRVGDIGRAVQYVRSLLPPRN
jgi:sugar phosphate isomerase/epimerase